MSRQTYFDALLDALRALAPSLGVPAENVAEWDGEDPTFNPDAVYPALFLAYSGSEIQEPEGIGGNSYERTFVFSVFVCTQTDDFGEAGDRARQILDGLEEGIQGPLAGTDRVVSRMGREELVSVHMGRATYGMRLMIRDSFWKAFS